MYRDKDKLAINVAKLYYRSDYSQQKIAQELGVSRPSISRLLQYAKDKGYVNIQIVDPVEDMSHMEQRLKDKLHLKDVKIASSTINDEEEIKKYIGIAAARYLAPWQAFVCLTRCHQLFLPPQKPAPQP